MNLVKYVSKTSLSSQGWFSAAPGSLGGWGDCSLRYSWQPHLALQFATNGFWVETSSDIFPCKSSCDTALGFPSLHPTGEGRVMPLLQFYRPRKSCMIWSQRGHSKLICVSGLLCDCTCDHLPGPISLLSFWVCLCIFRPVQMLALCTNGSHVGFAISLGSLEKENQKSVLGSLAAKSFWAPCHLLSFANLVNSVLIIMVFFCSCCAPGTRLHHMAGSLLISILKVFLAFLYSFGLIPTFSVNLNVPSASFMFSFWC